MDIGSKTSLCAYGYWFQAHQLRPLCLHLLSEQRPYHIPICVDNSYLPRTLLMHFVASSPSSLRTFKLHDCGLQAASMPGLTIAYDWCAHSLSQPRHIESILSDFCISDCNPADANEGRLQVSSSMSLQNLEEKLNMKKVPIVSSLASSCTWPLLDKKFLTPSVSSVVCGTPRRTSLGCRKTTSSLP